MSVRPRQILDLELMTVEFHDADTYLMDNTHPAAWFSRHAGALAPI